MSDNGFTHLENLLMEVKESLEREMRQGFTAVTTRFDTQAARLERYEVKKADGEK